MCVGAHEMRPEIFNGMVYLTEASVEEAGWMRPILCRYTHQNTYAHTYPWSVPFLVGQVVLRFDLHTVGQLKPPSLSSLFFLSVSRTFSLSPSLKPSGWLRPDSLGVFRFWRDPNFLF